jgi:hypothetical protein
MRLKSSMHAAVAIAFGGLTVIMPGTTVAASAQPARAAVQPARQLQPEQADVQAFGTQMRELVKLVDGVDDKAKPTKAEVDALVRQAAVVKRLLPAYQRAVSSSISKIKTAGKWNQELDTQVERVTQQRSPARVGVLRTSGGARAFLEKAATDPDLASLPQTLDAFIRDISGRSVIARLIDELTGVPVLAKSALGNAIRKVADAADQVSYFVGEVAEWVCLIQIGC